MSCEAQLARIQSRKKCLGRKCSEEQIPLEGGKMSLVENVWGRGKLPGRFLWKEDYLKRADVRGRGGLGLGLVRFNVPLDT